ncbi:MAG TPA: biotin transporter BioY [Eubacteriales bacterium]|nr:biotin transporter BioY [Clostridia bacterium]HRR89477.1 biotin transporter BioY [Eubacteriales bacterium]HRU84586.1 biotin transporter BioY [Eubacteriales bacterium]
MKSGTTRNLVLSALFAALIAAGAFMRIPLGDIPFTMQTFFVTLAGLLLGKKYGALAVVIYILIGLSGVPVFAAGGGIYYVFRPSFGYIIGFAVGAIVTGLIAEKNNSLPRLTVAAFSGILVIYAIGLIYYYLIATLYLKNNIAVKSLIISGFLLIVPDIVLTAFAALLARRLRSLPNLFIE